MSKACQLFSGSSGNSIFVAGKGGKFLVDAGVSAKRIDEALSQIGENADDLTAIFITHEHTDHIKGLRVFASRHKIPVFSSEAVIDKMLYDGKIGEGVDTHYISEDMEINGIEIVPVELSHDSVACHGYRFNMPDGRSISVCTDTGFITIPARKLLPGSDLMFLEANHEVTMLENGPYPYILKQRILSRKGHLSNDDCAEFATQLIKSGTTRLNLSHLSRENNYPDIAKQTVITALHNCGFKDGVDFRLTISSPVNAERPIIL